MADLTTKYMGISLKNPVIAGASNLVTNFDNITKMEEAGAAAIVYKSLFEEQVELERLQLSEELNEYNERHAEMISLFPDIQHAGPKHHLVNLRKTVDLVNIPVMASLNCTHEETWVDYAKAIEQPASMALSSIFMRFRAISKKKRKPSSKNSLMLLIM